MLLPLKPQSPVNQRAASALTVYILLTSLSAACRARSYTADPACGPSEDPLHGKSLPGAEGMRLRRDARRSD
jgi:hypothetical protein